MKRTSILIVVCFLVISTFGQTNEKPIRNLDFEIIENNKAKDWKTFGKGEYSLKVDTNISQNGKNSGLIEFKSGTPYFKAWAYSIPAVYKGKTIKLSGYIKTENVTGGYAGLWMRIDPSVAFDNMKKRGIKGTTDWTKYEIELNLNPSKAQKIVVGGLLVGKGKMWIDNLEVTIDGKQLNKVPSKKLSKIEKDTGFQKGSKINAIKINDEKIKDLKTLGFVWGFLKYYHPNIASGNYNWDFELFRILPKIIEAENTNERDKYLIEWINNLGEFKQATKEKKEKTQIKIKPDLDWLANSNLSINLISLLTNVKNAKRTDENYYIGLNKGIKNPNFSNEATYSDIKKYPDTGFRLLSLYRYWNIIQYYFPYKNLIEEDWKNVLSEFIPKFINAKNETEYKLAVLELITRVHDTHANIWSWDTALNKYWGMNYAPIELTFIENKAIVTGYLDKKFGQETGLIIGDNITTINNKLVSDMVKDQLKYTPASNYPTQLRDIAKKLLRTNNTKLDIEFIRNDKTQRKGIRAFSTKEINIYKKYQKKDTCFKFINKEIAYLYLGSINGSYLPDIFNKIKDTKGLIIDLRCYPSEFVVFSLGKYLLPEKTEFVRFSTGSIKKAGQFTLTKSLSVGQKNKDYYKGKVIILINEKTQSQAEYTTMAFRVAPNTIVIGSTTAGADGNVSKFYLPGNISTMISGIGVYYPDGTETQRIGIIPNIEIKPTIEGIKNNKDELLEKAIELIEK
ncbi:S41 family peptidase [Tenacibaculum halocynthiae]|uniref:S41 family peptidase n=1 Tax=Tenacibaculum halocynthiae TaxID=1254437 RepID=UPI003D64ABD4